MSFTVIEVIGIIAILQSVILAAFFLTHKKGNRQSNRILSAILGVFAVLISYSLVLQHGAFEDVYKFMIIGSQSALLIGPLVYLYVCSRLDPKFGFSGKDLLHAAPFVLAASYFVVRFYIIDRFIEWESPVRITNNIAILLQNGAYLILVLRKLTSHKVPVKAMLFESGNPGLSWLRILLLGYIAIWSINIQILVAFDVWGKYEFCPYIFSLYFLALFLLINVILFVALKKPAIVINSKRYQTSTLQGAYKSRLQHRLFEHMRHQKPYLDASCSMSSLSRELSCSSNHLSQLINETCGQNFYDFVNSYRITESKALMENGERRTILEIAYEVGFNSKTSFNKAFKKQTGVTPSEFRNLAKY